MMQSTPKLRGFKSRYAKLPIVNLSDLNAFEDGAIVDYKKMIQQGILDKRYDQVKVLGQGELTKKLTVIAEAFSASAKKAIEAKGGQAETK